ncbi:MAG: tRNA A-37 threonylcarbamoyl transferase component Bud32 [Halopseudomonas sp.]|jgi:tRNA A-37 threonylcarbamoyl transferase component Bud32
MLINIQSLKTSGREPPVPVEIASSAGQLYVERWLRIVPGRRLVGSGMLDGQKVLVKVFVSSRARKHWQRELDGLISLQQVQIASPGIIASGALDHGGYFICTAFLDDAATLQQRWDSLAEVHPGEPTAIALLGQALKSIGQLHSQGLAQTDLHMGNFLLQDERLYVIDGDAIDTVSPGQPLTSEQAEDNLAIFFAQLDAQWDELFELLLINYLKVNPLAINPDRLASQVRKVRTERLSDWLSKALRDCTQFMVRRNWWRFSVVVRQQADDLHDLIEQTDAAFKAIPTLKDGGSCSVTRVSTNQHELVIKRYNIKGMSHWLTRFWRPSRAWHSWLAAQRLRFLNIATPAPLAMIESRFGPLRRRAWFICEYCPGQNLLELFGNDGHAEPSEEQGEALLTLLRQLAGARISHGDFKATNLLWHAGQVWLIDLDGMQAHGSHAAWHKAWCVDRARLLRNWPASSPLTRWLDVNLP